MSYGQYSSHFSIDLQEHTFRLTSACIRLRV